MAYATTNPPSLVYRATSRGALWLYVSADVENTYDDSGYITNAKELGMQSGDIVFVIDTATPTASMGFVTVNATTGVGTLTAHTAIA